MITQNSQLFRPFGNADSELSQAFAGSCYRSKPDTTTFQPKIRKFAGIGRVSLRFAAFANSYKGIFFNIYIYIYSLFISYLAFFGLNTLIHFSLIRVDTGPKAANLRILA